MYVQKFLTRCYLFYVTVDSAPHTGTWLVEKWEGRLTLYERAWKWVFLMFVTAGFQYLPKL